MAEDPTQGSSTLLRGVERALSVLAALNRHNGATVTELSRASGIPRPSLYRVLESLCVLGYVSRREGQEVYELTPLVRALSDGYKEEHWVRGIARPVLVRLQREVIWPTNLTTFQGNAMHLRETTRSSSPMTIDVVTVGLRLPMLHSAAGRAYLAWCPAHERDLILKNLRMSGALGDSMVHDQQWVKKMLAATRTRGYGERQGEFVERTGAIAVPVFHANRVLACISITFILSALSAEEAASEHLPKLREAAALIESRMADRPM
jgi:IclR family mhp operon transcriptional activator